MLKRLQPLPAALLHGCALASGTILKTTPEALMLWKGDMIIAKPERDKVSLEVGLGGAGENYGRTLPRRDGRTAEQKQGPRPLLCSPSLSSEPGFVCHRLSRPGGLKRKRGSPWGLGIT